MPGLITENMGTILITLLLVLMVAGIIHTLIKDKKQGKSSCGGNCAHCGMCKACHKSHMKYTRDKT